MVDLLVPQCDKKAVGHEFDVGGHERSIHSDKIDGERIADKLLFKIDGLANNDVDGLFIQRMNEVVAIEESCEFAVKAFVPTDEFI